MGLSSGRAKYRAAFLLSNRCALWRVAHPSRRVAHIRPCDLTPGILQLGCPLDKSEGAVKDKDLLSVF
jgi:hypothetical protein